MSKLDLNSFLKETYKRTQGGRLTWDPERPLHADVKRLIEKGWVRWTTGVCGVERIPDQLAMTESAVKYVEMLNGPNMLSRA